MIFGTRNTIAILGMILSLLISSHAFGRSVRTANNIVVSLQSLAISGTTNVNSFWLRYSDQASTGKDVNEAGSSDLNNHPLTFTIPVKKFVFSNHCMRSDFYKMINAEAYPEIPVQIVDFKNPGELKDDSQEIITVNITLAGISKVTNVMCKIKKTDKNTFQIKGAKSLSLSDFKIVAPTKFLGMVKVKDEIAIAFDFKLSAGN
jgi:YceI-like domain.